MLGEVTVDTVGGADLRPRDRLVLGALAVRAGRAVAPEEIADAVWAEAPPTSWRKQVQICVARLRKSLPSGAIETTSDGGYRLVPTLTELDVAEFEHLLAQGRRFAATDEPDRAATAFARALSLVRGAPYRALDHWPPASSEAARLADLIGSAREDLLEARLAVGEHREVTAEAEALVAEDPLRERRWAALVLAQYRCGRQADALRSLRQARTVLRENLGIDPGPELVELERRVFIHDDGLRARPAQPVVATECPYKGLAALDAGDPIFGRDEEIAACLDRVGDRGLLVITGPSGSGKSSLVRAGIVPALVARARRCDVLVPDPAAGLDFPEGADVLVVDQFEELFASEADAGVARAACASVTDHALARGFVVMTVRADHLARLSTEPDLARLAQQNLHLLAAPTGDALREAIERPATEAGLRVEAGLVDLVVRDTEGEPGALPLMSHALAETWKRRDGGVLTVAAYRASGGISGAVARSADRLYERLAPAERSALRGVLLRLVSQSADGEPLRFRLPSRILQGDTLREEVTAQLVAARLVTAEDGNVEISHEALVRAWPRLRTWLEEDAAGVRIVRHLAATADGWEALGRPGGELYRGGRLPMVQEYVDTAHPNLTDVERAFLDTSLRHAEDEGVALRARAALDRRRARRLRVLLASSLALLLVTAGAVVVAARSAQAERRAATDATISALVNRSLALRSTDRDVAALLAVEAYRRWPQDARALSALFGTFTTSPGVVANDYVAGADSLLGAPIPGTRSALVARDGTQPVLWDLEEGRVVQELDLGVDAAYGRQVVVSADGTRAVLLLALPKPSCGDGDVLSPDGTCGAFVVLDLAAGRRLAGPVVTPDGPGAVAISPDGSLVAVTGRDTGTVTIHGVDGVELARVARLPGDVDDDTGGLAFAADDRLYAGSRAGPVREIVPRTGTVTRTFPLPPGYSGQHLDVAGDGMLVAGGMLGLAAVDVTSGKRLWAASLLGGTPDPCAWLAASAERQRLYCGSHYGEIEERDRTSGQRTGRVFDTQLGDVGNLALTDGGTELAVFGSGSPAITRWRLDGSGPVSRRVADGYVAADRFGYGEDTLVVARRAPDATRATDLSDYAIWSTATDTMTDHVSADAAMAGIGWAGRGLLTGMREDVLKAGWYDTAARTLVSGPDIGPECDHLWPTPGGARAYCGGLEGEVWRIDVASRKLLEPTLHLPGSWIRSVSERLGGRELVVTFYGDDRWETVVVDARTAKVVGGPLLGPDLTSVSTDGTLVGSSDGAITRYDPETLKPLAEFPGARGEINTLQFDDDGRILLATSNDQSASLYDVATGTRLGDPVDTDAPLIYPAFLHPDGTSLAVTDADGVVLWDLAPGHLADAACRIAGRELSATEWATYLAELGAMRDTCA